MQERIWLVVKDVQPALIGQFLSNRGSTNSLLRFCSTNFLNSYVINIRGSPNPFLLEYTTVRSWTRLPHLGVFVEQEHTFVLDSKSSFEAQSTPTINSRLPLLMAHSQSYWPLFIMSLFQIKVSYWTQNSSQSSSTSSSDWHQQVKSDKWNFLSIYYY